MQRRREIFCLRFPIQPFPKCLICKFETNLGLQDKTYVYVWPNCLTEYSLVTALFTLLLNAAIYLKFQRQQLERIRANWLVQNRLVQNIINYRIFISWRLLCSGMPQKISLYKLPRKYYQGNATEDIILSEAAVIMVFSVALFFNIFIDNVGASSKFAFMAVNVLLKTNTDTVVHWTIWSKNGNPAVPSKNGNLLEYW